MKIINRHLVGFVFDRNYFNLYIPKTKKIFISVDKNGAVYYHNTIPKYVDGYYISEKESQYICGLRKTKDNFKPNLYEVPFKDNIALRISELDRIVLADLKVKGTYYYYDDDYHKAVYKFTIEKIEYSLFDDDVDISIHAKIINLKTGEKSFEYLCGCDLGLIYDYYIDDSREYILMTEKEALEQLNYNLLMEIT